jgi:dihydroorotase
LFNPSKSYVLEEKHLHSKSKNSLFLGSKLKGTVYGIIANNTTSIPL